MTPLNKSKIIAAFLAVFLVGVVSGWFLSLRWAHRPQLRPPKIEDYRQHVRDKYQRRLNLTPEQLEKVQPLLDERFRTLEAVQTEVMQRIDQICKKSASQISAELSPEQQRELEEMEKERREFRLRRPKNKAGNEGSP